MSSVRTPTSLGTHGTARSGSKPKMWRAAAWRGWAGQAFVPREPGVADGTTADSLVVNRHAPQQDGQTGKSNPGAPGCLRILVQSLRANASPLINEPTV
jgi:hypothetical protein